MADFKLLVDWLFSWVPKIFNLYTGTFVLCFSLALWVLDRIFGIFDMLRRR